MRYLSRNLLLYAVGILLIALSASISYAEHTGVYHIDVDSETAGSYKVLTDDLMSGSDGNWVDDASLVSIDKNVVLTIDEFTLAGSTDQYIIAVSYDFSVISGSLYANADTPLTFYSDYVTKTEGTADFQGMTAAKINSIIKSSDKTLGGYLVITLNSGDYYRPAVVVNTGEFSISPVSAEMQLVIASSDTLALEAQNYSGRVIWEIVSDYDSNSYYPVKTSITSSDSGHKAVLTFTVPKSADIGQYGYVEVIATDQGTGAWASSYIDYDVGSQVTVKPSVSLISVDLNGTARVGLTVRGAYSGGVTYSTSEGLWTSFEGSDNYSQDVVINPYNEFLEGGTWPVSVTVRDWRGLSGDKRGQATAAINVYVYGALSLDVSSTAFTVSSADTPDVTFSAKNASGDLSFEVSESWAAVSGSKFVINTIDESLQGTTQTVTVTAKDDRGRAGNSRGESSVTLSVTVSNDFVPALALVVTPASLTVNQGGSETATATASNALGTVTYTSDQSWAAVSGNTITVNYDSAYAGQTLTAVITATDAGRSFDKTAAANLSVSFGEVPPVPVLGVTASPAYLTVNPGGSASASASASNALGTVNYSSSASWAVVNGNTITVNYDSAYAGQTLNATITGTDTGRTSDNTATATLSVTFGDIIIPDPDPIVLSLSSSTPAVSVRAGSTNSINLSLTGAGTSEVSWSYVYDSVPSGASSSGNPLGLSFSGQSSTSAVLTVNPDSTAVPGDYTVRVSTSTTSGTSTGGDAVITVTVNAAAVLSILPPTTSVSCTEGESFRIAFSAQNSQGTVSWDIVNTSWGTAAAPAALSLPADGTSVTLEGLAVTAGTYSFTVRAVDGAGSASASVTLVITEPENPTDDTTTNSSRAKDAYSITIRAAELTQEVIANLRASLGLTASDEIRTLTAENILSVVSPDIQTETAMNKRGYQLAASLSRIRVTKSGLYAFVFSLPLEYVGFSTNDLAVFAKVLESSGEIPSEGGEVPSEGGTVAAGFFASALGEDGLNEGDLLGTDGRRITNAASDMLAVFYLDAGTISGTFFGSVVIPQPIGLDELSITTAEITDEFKSNLAENERVDFDVNTVRSITEANIYAPIEPTQAIAQSIKQEDGYDLAYKLNTIIVSEDGYYAFAINLPDELVGLASKDISVYLANMNHFTGSEMKTSDLVFGVLNAIEVDAFGFKLDTVGKKIVAIAFLQAGTPFSVYLAKMLIMLLLGGCETSSASYAGYGLIALAGVVILLGARFSRRR